MPTATKSPKKPAMKPMPSASDKAEKFPVSCEVDGHVKVELERFHAELESATGMTLARAAVYRKVLTDWAEKRRNG